MDHVTHGTCVMSSVRTRKMTLRVVVFILGCGRTGPDPASDVTLKDGTVVPCGKGTKTTVSNSSLLYNEYPLTLHALSVSNCNWLK